MFPIFSKKSQGHAQPSWNEKQASERGDEPDRRGRDQLEGNGEDGTWKEDYARDEKIAQCVFCLQVQDRRIVEKQKDHSVDQHVTDPGLIASQGIRL